MVHDSFFPSYKSNTSYLKNLNASKDEACNKIAQLFRVAQFVPQQRLNNMRFETIILLLLAAADAATTMVDFKTGLVVAKKVKRHFGEDHSKDGPFVKGTATKSVEAPVATSVINTGTNPGTNTTTPFINSTSLSPFGSKNSARGIFSGMALVGSFLLL